MSRACRALVTLTALAALVIPVAAQAPLREHLDPGRLQVHRDSFVVLMRGTARGWQVLSAARDGAGWTLGDAITITGMVSQASSIRFDAALNELALRQEGTMMGKPMRIALDKAAGRVTGTALTPSNPTGEITIDVPHTEGLLDDNAVTSLLAVVRWRDSLSVRFPVLASGKGTIAPWTATALGRESVTVPAGTFDTWRIELSMSGARMVANVTTAAPHRIVRMSNGPAFDIQLVH